jgi:hypothetical protein
VYKNISAVFFFLKFLTALFSIYIRPVINKMSSKPGKRPAQGDKAEKINSASASKRDEKSSTSNDDDYEKGKTARGGARAELNADRKAVEELDKWG